MSEEIKVTDDEARKWANELSDQDKVELKRQALLKRAIDYLAQPDEAEPNWGSMDNATFLRERMKRYGYEMSFNYENTETPDDVVRSVAAEMSGGGLKPLSDDERLERERWREELHQRHLEQQAEREHRQAVADEAARQVAAAEIAEANRQRRLQQQREYQERADQRSRNLDLSALKFEAQQASAWRSAVQHDLRAQHVQSLYGELEKMLSPPTPPAEPAEVIERDPLGSADFFDDDYNPNYYADKFAGKFKR